MLRHASRRPRPRKPSNSSAQSYKHLQSHGKGTRDSGRSSWHRVYITVLSPRFVNLHIPRSARRDAGTGTVLCGGIHASVQRAGSQKGLSRFAQALRPPLSPPQNHRSCPLKAQPAFQAIGILPEHIEEFAHLPEIGPCPLRLIEKRRKGHQPAHIQPVKTRHNLEERTQLVRAGRRSWSFRPRYLPGSGPEFFCRRSRPCGSARLRGPPGPAFRSSRSTQWPFFALFVCRCPMQCQETENPARASFFLIASWI